MKQEDVHKNYLRRFIIVMVSYMITLMSVTWAVNNVLPMTRWNILISLIPVLPMVYGIWAFSEFLAGIDEFQREIQMRAIVFAAGLTGVLTFSYGLMESFADLPSINLTWVFPAMIAIWGLALAYFTRLHS